VERSRLRKKLPSTAKVGQDRKAGLAGWIRTTWLPNTLRLPQELREQFIDTLANRYLREMSLTREGKASVAMMRLEVEAIKK
jgi:trans-aconitate 2-methyltransferase